MKKGILVILGLLVFGLVSGFAYIVDFLEADEPYIALYEKIILKNDFGKFELPIQFAVRRAKDVEVVLFNPADVKFITVPKYVNLSETKAGHYDFGADLVGIIYFPHFMGHEEDFDKVSFVEMGTNQIVNLFYGFYISTKHFTDWPLKKLKNALVLEYACRKGLPVSIEGRITDISYWYKPLKSGSVVAFADVLRATRGFTLTIEIQKVEI